MTKIGKRWKSLMGEICKLKDYIAVFSAVEAFFGDKGGRATRRKNALWCSSLLVVSPWWWWWCQSWARINVRGYEYRKLNFRININNKSERRSRSSNIENISGCEGFSFRIRERRIFNRVDLLVDNEKQASGMTSCQSSSSALKIQFFCSNQE